MISKLNYPHIGMLLLAFVVADLACALLIRVAPRLGMMDRPGGEGGYKAHERPVPVLGGVAIYIAFALTVFSTLRFADLVEYRHAFEYFTAGPGAPLFGVALAGGIVTAMGLVDDIRPINAIVKLVVLFLVVLLLQQFGVVLNLLPDIAGLPAPWHDLPDITATLLWVVGVSSATNSLDNMDGASAGTAAVAAGGILLVCWGLDVETAQRWPAFASVALCGACLGFLRHNFGGARIYMGDSGSLFVGFALAALTVMVDWSTDPLVSIIVPFLILGVPIYDIVLSTLLRIVEGRVRSVPHAILYCGRDHVTHRLHALGLSKRAVVLVLYGIGAVLAGIAWMFVLAGEMFSRTTIIVITALVVTALGVLGRRLSRATVE